LPKLKYHPSKDIPAAARELKTLSPTDISEWILGRFNREIKSNSVTKWFSRHPKIREELVKEIAAEVTEEVEVSEETFENGTFVKLESVARWIQDMEDRIVSKRKIASLVGSLKQVCRGQFNGHGIDLVKEGLWTYKHPDRLTEDDVMEIIRELRSGKIETSAYRSAARNFLMSQNKPYRRISGAKATSSGSLAKMFVEKPILKEMLGWIDELNHQAYLVDEVMYRTGGRINAVLAAKLEDYREENVKGEMRRELTIYDKGRRSKYPDGKPWDKYISPSLYKDLCEWTGKDLSDPSQRNGELFNISKEEMAQINKAAIMRFCPWIPEKYGKKNKDGEVTFFMWNHFWRHMFGQHMLRATGWNYGVVAALGGWTVKALEESYGKAPKGQVREWGAEYVEDL